MFVYFFPALASVPEALHLLFKFANLRRPHATISGHPRQDADAAINLSDGQVGADLTTEEGYAASREIEAEVENAA